MEKLFVKYWKVFSNLIVFLDILFVFCCICAIISFPGGYSFNEHMISSLGWIEVDGVSNHISRTIFIVACISLSFGGFCLYYLIYISFSKYKKKRIKIGFILGLISLICLIGLALVPADTQNTLHGIFASTFFILTEIAIFLNMSGIEEIKKYPILNILSHFLWLITLAYCVYSIITTSIGIHAFKVIFQKIGVISLISNILIFNNFIRKIFSQKIKPKII